MKKKPIEQSLFEVVHSLGERLSGPLHIINNTEEDKVAGVEITYRVYHKKGYAFDVSRVLVKADKHDRLELISVSFEYNFFAEWSGFNKIDATGAYRLIMDHKRMKENHAKTKE